jgi:hypothetical protein
MFCGVRKIQEALRVGSVLYAKGLTPVCSISHGADLLGFPDLASLPLPFRQLTQGGGIGEARKIGELTDVDLVCSSGGALRDGFPNRNGAHLDPLLLDQGNHGPIDTQHTALWRRQSS